MRAPADAERVRRLLRQLGQHSRIDGKIYLTGGASAVLIGWRPTTIDVDLKLVGGAETLLRHIPPLKEELEINVELAAPDDFIPALPDWEDRSVFIAREGLIDCLHYDFRAQALAKLERAHALDLIDVKEMLARGLVERASLVECFRTIEPQLYRFPAIDPSSFRERVFGLTA